MSDHHYRNPRVVGVNYSEDVGDTERIVLTVDESQSLQEGVEDALMKLMSPDDEQGKLLVQLLLTASEYPSADKNHNEIDKISESCRNEFQNVSTLITNFKHQRVEPARDKLKQRYEDSETAKGAVSTVGGVVGIAGSATAGGLLASPILGVAGLIIVGSVTVTAPLVIPVAVVVGLIGIGALGYGIWKFMKKYGNHQTLAMKSLECLAKLCDKMKSEATKMIEHSNHLLKNTDNLCSKLKKLTYSLKSEQQRRMHAEACGQIKNANQTLAKTLKTIIDFEMTSCSELGDTLLSSNQHAITSSD
ncbi:unnamed protein product [Rotaria magnacalcarata]|uniref:Uncharacterized protein n=1 Tax=Rotaria magnacalcarata TaxID=392030 RepID=A0A8S2QTX7_9BILA|nr:unnamed protein product [Rotaria magnacalcarata]